MNAHAAIIEAALGSPARARSPGIRPEAAAIAFCVGVWLLAFWLFETPTLLAGHTDWATWTFQITCSVTGLSMCLGVLVVVRATRGMASDGARLGLILLTAFIGLAVHSAVDTQVLFQVIPDQLRRARALHSPLGPFVLMTLMNAFQLVAVYIIFLAGLAVGWSMLAIQERERRLVAAQAAAQEAQLAALRFQINPHFLFNALNAVTSLVGAGRNAEAETVVSRLSDFFRASLTTAPGELATLEDELDVAGAYLDIETARFGARLQVDIDFEEAVRQALTPHFLLQPLLENAVKYGVACTSRPVTVRLHARREADDLVLEVRDDGEPDGASGPPRGAGVGLGNVEARLAALFGARGRLRTERLSPGFLAEIRLPFHRLGRAEQERRRACPDCR